MIRLKILFVRLLKKKYRIAKPIRLKVVPQWMGKGNGKTGGGLVVGFYFTLLAGSHGACYSVYYYCQQDYAKPRLEAAPHIKTLQCS